MAANTEIRALGQFDLQMGKTYDALKARRLIEELTRVEQTVNSMIVQLNALAAAGSSAVGVHVLATETGLGPDHTVSGLTVGHVLKAVAAAAAEFAALKFSELDNTDPATFAAPAPGSIIQYVSGYWSAVPLATGLGLTNPGAPALLGWNLLPTPGLSWYNLGPGLTFAGGSLDIDPSNIDHNALKNLTVGDPHPQYSGYRRTFAMMGG